MRTNLGAFILRVRILVRLRSHGGDLVGSIFAVNNAPNIVVVAVVVAVVVIATISRRVVVVDAL